MEITPYHKDVFSGKICPYCKSGTKVVSESQIYGKTYNPKRSIICCNNYPQCNSYVGTDDDGIALGRLANKELRRQKQIAHSCFDRLWKLRLMDRDEAYEEMSDYFRIPKEYTHIGMFSVLTCKQVTAWSIKMYNELKDI